MEEDARARARRGLGPGGGVLAGHAHELELHVPRGRTPEGSEGQVEAREARRLDGRQIASETPLRRYSIKPGTHTLVVTNPAKSFRAQRKIRITSNSETRVFVYVVTGKVTVR